MKIGKIKAVAAEIERQKAAGTPDLKARVEEAQRVADRSEKYGPGWWTSEEVRDAYLRAIVSGDIHIGS